MTGQTPPPKSSSQQRLDELVILNNKLVEQNAQLIRLATPKRGLVNWLRLIPVIPGAILIVLACAITFFSLYGDGSAMQRTQVMTEATFFLILGFGFVWAGAK